ncbi:hypothetical protein EW026_g8116 [Hermanssonia centrifuga]|uniref:Uncharacterized protein n=1 Tax=Hermanssonia centrifuga TaxID=98765 RepID=A0A4S4K5G2_9APHY|nr:hypothetical protein EW026_g8116 [Hermanssonia centrifuga]
MDTDRKTATLVNNGVKHPPVLTGGSLTPEVLQSFQIACRHHFNYKKVPEADKVTTVAPSLQSPVAQQWYFAHEAVLKSGSFDDFMVALQHIKSHAFEELRILAETAEVIALADFQEFKETLSDADSKRRIDRNRRKREIEAFITSRARFTIPAAPSRTSANAVKPLINGPSAGSTANVRRAAALPKLTDSERKLLEQSKGCLKCRKLNAGHFAKNCPDGFPDAASYRDLVTGKVAIAPIAVIDTVEGDIFQIRHVGAVQGTSSAPSCVLTSDDDDWDSDMYVKSSISLPHIL